MVSFQQQQTYLINLVPISVSQSSVYSYCRYSKAPLFVTKPRSSEAYEGDTVVIICEVVGDPKPEVSWLRDWLKVGRIYISFI